MAMGAGEIWPGETRTAGVGLQSSTPTGGIKLNGGQYLDQTRGGREGEGGGELGGGLNTSYMRQPLLVLAECLRRCMAADVALCSPISSLLSAVVVYRT